MASSFETNSGSFELRYRKAGWDKFMSDKVQLSEADFSNAALEVMQKVVVTRKDIVFWSFAGTQRIEIIAFKLPQNIGYLNKIFLLNAAYETFDDLPKISGTQDIDIKKCVSHQGINYAKQEATGTELLNAMRLNEVNEFCFTHLYIANATSLEDLAPKRGLLGGFLSSVRYLDVGVACNKPTDSTIGWSILPFGLSGSGLQNTLDGTGGVWAIDRIPSSSQLENESKVRGYLANRTKAFMPRTFNFALDEGAGPIGHITSYRFMYQTNPPKYVAAVYQGTANSAVNFNTDNLAPIVKTPIPTTWVEQSLDILKGRDPIYYTRGTALIGGKSVGGGGIGRNLTEANKFLYFDIRHLAVEKQLYNMTSLMTKYDTTKIDLTRETISNLQDEWTGNLVAALFYNNKWRASYVRSTNIKYSVPPFDTFKKYVFLTSNKNKFKVDPVFRAVPIDFGRAGYTELKDFNFNYADMYTDSCPAPINVTPVSISDPRINYPETVKPTPIQDINDVEKATKHISLYVEYVAATDPTIGPPEEKVTDQKDKIDIDFVLDFDKLAELAALYGWAFGVTGFDISGAARKTVQQTRGISDGLENFKNNFYVDTWYSGPKHIKLEGLLEKINPTQYDDFHYKADAFSGPAEGRWFYAEPSDGGAGDIKRQDFNDFQEPVHFMQIFQKFFDWNNNPTRASRGDQMFLTDGENIYGVTMHDLSFRESAASSNVISWSISFTVLRELKNTKLFPIQTGSAGAIDAGPVAAANSAIAQAQSEIDRVKNIIQNPLA